MIAARSAPSHQRKEHQVHGQVQDVQDDLAGAWQAIQRELASSMHEDTFRLWFAPLAPVSRRGATLYLTGPQRVIRWVRRRYLDFLRTAILNSDTGLREVELVSDQAARAHADHPAEAASRVALNPDYTFDRFVIGPGNQVAHAAAIATAPSSRFTTPPPSPSPTSSSPRSREPRSTPSRSVTGARTCS
jgi:hypothetical protein